MTKQDVLDSLWVEKYRPASLADVALVPEYREKFNKFVSEKSIPHLLLEGPPGSGKTTVAKILVKTIDCDWEISNASDDRGIDIVRGKIKSFAQMASFKGLKIMILDESDHMTPDAQASLRALMEQYAKSTRFILTCNYVNKIIDPLQSRCQVFKFSAFPKSEMRTILVNILTAEKISHDEADLDKHIELCYPDLRKAINMMQQNVRSGKFVYQDKQLLFKKLVELILKKDLKELRKELNNNYIDYQELYRYIYDNVSLFPQGGRLQILLDTAEYLYRNATIADQEINFVAFTIKILSVLK